jgi:predicted AlkP superfamily pyrophosphatase or phosphodiesterase
VILSGHYKVHEALFRRGAHSLSAKTIHHSDTLPSHAAMLSGVDDHHHGLDWNSWKPERGFIKVPTIFDAVERGGMHSAAFVGKRKLEHIAAPGTVEKFERPGYLCKKVSEEAAHYFGEKRPNLLFVHFSDPDEYGHANGWLSQGYERGIADSDRCLGRIVDAIADSGLEGETLLILSADHGGHAKVHSGGAPEDRLIPWIAVGPNVRQDYAIARQVRTVDTAATALYALGLSSVGPIEGKPLVEIFKP